MTSTMLPDTKSPGSSTTTKTPTVAAATTPAVAPTTTQAETPETKAAPTTVTLLGEESKDVKPADGKGGEPAPSTATEPVPDKYELKHPVDGMAFDPEFLKSFEDVAREQKLSNKSAQAWVDKMVPALDASIMRAIEQSRAAARERSLNDPLIGNGDPARLKEVVLGVKDGVDWAEEQVPGLRKELNSSGAGDKPEYIRLFAAVTKLLKLVREDKIVKGQPAAEIDTRDPVDKLADTYRKY